VTTANESQLFEHAAIELVIHIKGTCFAVDHIPSLSPFKKT
jgi:hypothetical protein